MKITELSLKNFKSWEQIDKMKLAPITGLFGTNSSGKTSILQLLLMLKQTVESTDRLQVLDFGSDKSPANLGSFRDVVFGHVNPGKLECSLRWELDKSLEIKGVEEESRDKVLFSGKEMGFKAVVEESEKNKLQVKQLEYSLAQGKFIMKRKDGGKDKYELAVDSTTDFRLKKMSGRQWDLPGPVKCYGFPNEINARYQNAGFFADLQLQFENLFSGTKYLGPLRDYPRRQYSWSGTEPIDMGMRGERVVEALLAAGAKGLKVSKGPGLRSVTLEERVAEWLKELGLINSFEVEKEGGNVYRVKVKRSAHSADVLITDVGFGVSQILPAIVLCYYVPKGSVIILEQPEIHLHPAVQSGLADVFIDAVKRRKIQIIFESHSEHLLRRFQRRIAEKSLSNDDVAFYFSEMGEKSSKLQHLDVDLFGTIKNWPEDFFGDQFGEMLEITKAGMKAAAK